MREPRHEQGRGREQKDRVEQAREDVEIGQRVEERRRFGRGRRRQRDERREEVNRLGDKITQCQVSCLFPKGSRKD